MNRSKQKTQTVRFQTGDAAGMSVHESGCPGTKAADILGRLKTLGYVE
jgi:hypothetical protein